MQNRRITIEAVDGGYIVEWNDTDSYDSQKRVFEKKEFALNKISALIDKPLKKGKKTGLGTEVASG